eukprot:scaffold6638_cov127-Cylindrotheca_fusiformis.AAC.8
MNSSTANPEGPENRDPRKLVFYDMANRQELSRLRGNCQKESFPHFCRISGYTNRKERLGFYKSRKTIVIKNIHVKVRSCSGSEGFHRMGGWGQH